MAAVFGDGGIKTGSVSSRHSSTIHVTSDLLRPKHEQDSRVDSSELNDIISEIQDIASEKDQDQTDEQSDDELNKTPDEAEQELTWMKDVGLENIAHRYEEGKEITDDIIRKDTATLTKKQSQAVQKRVNTLNNTIRKKQKQQHRSVKGVFSADSEAEPLSVHHNSNTSSNDYQRNGMFSLPPAEGVPAGQISRHSPHRKDSKKVTIVRLPSRGEYSMHGHGSDGTSGVETISIQQKEIPSSPDGTKTLTTKYKPRTLVDDDLTISFKSEDLPSPVDQVDSASTNSTVDKPTSSSRSRKDGLPNFILEPETLGITRVNDLSKKDLLKVRTLALIELTALFDLHEITFSRRKSKKKFKENGVFGVPLNTLYEHDCKKRPNVRVPIFVKELITHLEKCGLEEEGILRVPGSATRIKQLRQEIEEKFQSGRFSWEDVLVNDAASMLKQFVRELPIPLFTFEYFEAFAEIEAIPDESLKTQLQALNLCVLMLPEAHRNTLQMLLKFLKEIVDISDNKMTLNNVAMIMAPNLFLLPSQRKGKSPALDITYAARKSNIVRMLIKYQDILWTVPSFILSQVRSQYEAELVRKTKDKSNFMRFIGRKEKAEPLKKPNIHNEGDFNEGIIRVQAPHMTKDSTAVQLDPMTTAYDIVTRFQYASNSTPDNTKNLPNDKNSQALDKDPFFSTTHLHEDGGNIDERRLDHSTKMLPLYKVNPNARWIIRTTQPD